MQLMRSIWPSGLQAQEPASFGNSKRLQLCIWSYWPKPYFPNAFYRFSQGVLISVRPCYNDGDIMADPGSTNNIDPGLSREPLNILFNPGMVAKKNVWDIDLLEILRLMGEILERNGTRDLRVAGIAALSSALIYRMKVESIFVLQKEAMEKKPPRQQRVDPGIRTISMPYRHQSTYAVSLDDLLGLLQSLVVSIANPRSQRRQLMVEPAPVPDIREHMISVESIIGGYRDLILKKIRRTGRGSLDEIVSGLDSLDSIRCFFAALFLARDGNVDLEQDGEYISIILVKDPKDGKSDMGLSKV